MGSALCTLFSHKPVKVVFYGLHAAGKTTLLYKLKLGNIATVPTLGFNVEDLEINGVKTVIWDLGIRTHVRALIPHYLHDMDAVVFVIDSSNEKRMREAVEEFFSHLNSTVQDRQVPVLVLANKQDVHSAVLSPEEIKKAIYERGGDEFRAKTALEVFPSVALTLEGVSPALDWLTSQLALRIARRTYLPSSASQWSKAVVQYPASFVKSAYLRVVGLVRSVEDGKGKDSQTVVAAKG